jgi:hypothetical protein
MLVLACADATDPAAPSAVVSADPPLLATDGGAAPTEAEFAAMPAEFRTSPSVFTVSTDVGFLPAEHRAYARGFMNYLATNAVQEVDLSLRFDGSEIASGRAVGEQSDWLPGLRMLLTTAYVGVSGPCGHLAEGTTTHKAWHQFLVGGWKFLSWGNHAKSSYGGAEQDACEPPPPPPPPPPGGGSGDEYNEGCDLCQQWFYVIRGVVVDEWWECNPIPEYFCDGLMT